MTVQVEKLKGKTLLYQNSRYDLTSFATLAREMGMIIKSDRGHENTFAAQFSQVKAAAGLLCVLFPSDADELLALPTGFHKKLVVLRTHQAMDYPDMPKKYELIERSGIEMMYEEWHEGWFQDFAATLGRAVNS